MKKQLMMFSLLLGVTTGLCGASFNEVMSELQRAGGAFGAQVFNQSFTTSQQNKSLNDWADAFSMAKTFVTENSKNLVGSKDSVLMNVLSKTESINAQFINIIINMRTALNSPSQLNTYKPKLMDITNGARAARNQLSTTTFTLNNKKQAEKVLDSITHFLATTSDNLVNSGMFVAPALPGRKLPTPPTRPLPPVPGR